EHKDFRKNFLELPAAQNSKMQVSIFFQFLNLYPDLVFNGPINSNKVLSFANEFSVLAIRVNLDLDFFSQMFDMIFKFATDTLEKSNLWLTYKKFVLTYISQLITRSAADKHHLVIEKEFLNTKLQLIYNYLRIQQLYFSNADANNLANKIVDAFQQNRSSLTHIGKKITKIISESLEQWSLTQNEKDETKEKPKNFSQTSFTTTPKNGSKRKL